MCDHDRPEIWADIPGWPHQASNNGRVRTIAGRILTQRDHNRPVDSDLKYQRVDLCHNGSRTRLVHQLVCLAFHGDPDCKRVDGKFVTQEACHADDNPTHNCLENLHWGWPWENVAERLGQPGYYSPEAAARRSEAARTARHRRSSDPITGWLEEEPNAFSDLSRGHLAAFADRLAAEIDDMGKTVPDNGASPFRRWVRAACSYAPWHRRGATRRNTPGGGDTL